MTQNKSAQAALELSRGLPCGRFTIKLARTPAEKESVYRLRYQVFNDELGEGIPENSGTGLDQDDFDQYCEHLMLIADGKVVGTYRLMDGDRRAPSGFYTQTEFDLLPLALDWDKCVELGRGCISPEYRKQTTLMTLFWGLHRYMMAHNARHLLGCGSLPPMSNDDAEATFEKIRELGKVDESRGVTPLASHASHGDARKGNPQIPPLMTMYLEFGALIYGRPAYDPIFRCHDLLVVFDMDHLSPWGTELLERFDRRLLAGTVEQD